MGKIIRTGHNDVLYLCTSSLGVPAIFQKITISGTHSVSNAMTKGRVYRLKTTTDCHVQYGTAPEATTSTHFMFAGESEDIICKETGLKVSVIQSATGGTLYISLLDGTDED